MRRNVSGRAGCNSLLGFAVAMAALLGAPLAVMSPSVSVVAPVGLALSSGSGPATLGSLSDNPAYLENFTLTAAFEAKMQYVDGGITEAEDYFFQNTDNTLEAIWIWSRFYTLTRDNRYFDNISAAWNYSWAHPAWLEPDSGKVYSCAWAMKAELEYRRAYDDFSNLQYAKICANFISRRNGWEPGGTFSSEARNDIRGLAAGNLYDWAVEQGNDTARTRAVEIGNYTQANITANPSWLSSESWALAGGVAYWGIVHSTFREYPNVSWADQYGALLKTNVTNPGVGLGNSQCGWYAWYALGHYAAWEATSNSTHLDYFLGMVAWLILQDGDRDGGIPTNFGDPDNTDESWVTSYRALDLGVILPAWHFQRPDPPVLMSAVLSGPWRGNLTIGWNLSLQDSPIGDVIRYDVYRGESYNSSGSGYSLAANVTAGVSNFTDHIAAGDSSNHFYFLRAVDTEWLVSGDSGQAGMLHQYYPGILGHALLSNPFSPRNDSVEAVMSGIDFDYVRAYDASDSVSPWRSYVMGRPHQSLTLLPTGSGFWANVSAPTGIRRAGLVPREVLINLKTGWNLVGYCPMINSTVGDALAGIPWLAVELLSPSSAPYHLGQASGTDELHPGEGFWVLVGSDSVLRFTN